MIVTNSSRELRVDELNAVTGGSFDLGNLIGAVNKAIVVTAPEPTTITIFGVEIPLPPPK
jgi:hypothetical protein